MRITCACGKVLQVDSKLLGKKVRCPACKAGVLVEDQVIDDEVEEPRSKSVRASAQTPKTRRPVADDEDEFDEEDARPRKKKKQKAKTSGWLLWAGIGGGVGVLAIAVLVVILLSSGDGQRTKKQPGSLAQKGPIPNQPIGNQDLIQNPPALQSYKDFPHVKVLTGVTDIKNMKGRKVKIKGELSLITTKGNEVVVQKGEVYNGPPKTRSQRTN